jgi:cytochrome c551/c552
MKKYLLIAMLIVLAMMMAACGDDNDDDEENNSEDTAPTPTVEVLPTVEMGATEEAGAVGGGDAGNGETLFTSLGCVGCHSVDTAEDGTGPSLRGVATRAGERVAGLSAEEYLHQSLVEPEAYVVEGFDPVMPSFADQPEQALNDLVAFLMTLDE